MPIVTLLLCRSIPANNVRFIGWFPFGCRCCFLGQHAFTGRKPSFASALNVYQRSEQKQTPNAQRPTPNAQCGIPTEGSEGKEGRKHRTTNIEHPASVSSIGIAATG